MMEWHQQDSKTGSCGCSSGAGLLSTFKVLGSHPSISDVRGGGACACKPNTQKVEAGGSETQSHPRLRSEFQTIVGHSEALPQNQSISQSVKGVGTPDPNFGSTRIITVIRTVFKIKKEGRKK